MTTITLRSDTFILANATVPVDLVAGGALAGDGERLARADIRVARGRIEAIVPAIAPAAGPAEGSAAAGDMDRIDIERIDLRRRMVLPRFVDMHTHIDKGHIWTRSPNPDGTHTGARNAVGSDRERNWSADDVRRRMDFALRCAYAHGTSVLRTHIDSLGKQAVISWPALGEMREGWRGRVEVQAVALFPVDMVVDDPAQFDALVGIIARHGGAIGGLTFTGPPPDGKLDRALDRIFQAAAANGLGLDFHVDESGSPDARSLEAIALAALRHKFKGSVVAGHCCSLALQEDEDRKRVIDRVGEAGIAVVSLPMCNMYLQDRVADRTPRWRGVAPLHELDAAGVKVAVASDNTRDPFYAYGDLDMIEVFREAGRIVHFDHSRRPWLKQLGAAQADIIGARDAGRIGVGGNADLVIVGARTLNELLCRPWSDRTVMVAGKPIARELPDYAELDEVIA